MFIPFRLNKNKKILTVFFIACMAILSNGCSQTNKIEKGYAYARAIISGVKPTISVAEDGSILQKSKDPGIQYFIYVQTKDTSFLSIKKIWIKGKEYNADAEAVNDFPIVLSKNLGSPENYDTLVNACKFKTWRINVGQIISPSDTSFTKPNQPKESEVLIGFLYKNNIHYYSIAKIRYLESLRLQ